jgi:hypothetical protein
MLQLNKDNQHMEVETNALVKEVSMRLNSLEESVSELGTKLSLFDKDKINQKQLARDVLRSILSNEGVGIAIRLEASRDFLKLGGNGEGKILIKKLVLNNKELWRYIIDQDNKNFSSEEMKEYYISSLEEIKQRVLI